MDQSTGRGPEVFKALSDNTRWSIVQQVARVPELAFSQLEDRLSVGKPTISHHTRILAQAGVIDVSKRGRSTSFSLRHGALEEVMAELSTIASPSGSAAHDARPPVTEGEHATQPITW